MQIQSIKECSKANKQVKQKREELNCILKHTLHSIRQSLKKEEPSDGSALTLSRLRYTLISISSTLSENDLNCTFNDF